MYSIKIQVNVTQKAPVLLQRFVYTVTWLCYRVCGDSAYTRASRALGISGIICTYPIDKASVYSRTFVFFSFLPRLVRARACTCEHNTRARATAVKRAY